MRKVIALTLLIAAKDVCSQNLVVDPSFENFIPNGSGYYLHDYLYDWASYMVTADYYNSALHPNVVDYTGTDARTGSGFAGGYVFGQFTQWNGSTAYNREYIYGKLSSPLEAGRHYQVEFYVKPMSKPPVIPYCIDRIGIYFSEWIMSEVPDNYLHVVTPQVENTIGTICDEQNWTRIHGCFRAKGGEQFITIGNFYTDNNTAYQLLPGDSLMSGIDPQAYYLFDDISVVALADKPLGSAKHTICADSAVSLDAGYPNASAYQWSTGATSSQVTITGPGLYTVDITTEGGCVLSDTATVHVNDCQKCEPIFPNAFTPNGDGYNDAFHLLGGCDFTEFSLGIYNRWGEEVFRSANSIAAWDGTFRNAPCPAGVYTFLASGTHAMSDDGKPVQVSGNVTLMR